MTCYDNDFDVFEYDNSESFGEGCRDWSAPPQPSLARLVSPTQLTLTRRGETLWAMRVRPVPGAGVLDQWRRDAFHKPLTCVALRVEALPDPVAAGASLLKGVPPVVRGSVLPQGKSLINVLGDGTDDERVIVFIDGPVEDLDIRAMANAFARGESPLNVEVRAEAALSVMPGKFVSLEARDERVVLQFAAELLRQHLATIRRRPAREFGSPELWQLQRLLSITGTLSIQPIETEVFSTAIDVGISTSPLSEPRPADRSLIYDIFSGTWHDEP